MNLNLFLCSIFVSLLLFSGCSEKSEITDEDNENEELPECCQVGTSRASLLSGYASSPTSGESPAAKGPSNTE